jgi:hypothetical protein
LVFDARLTNLLCKNILVVKPKELKTASNLAESSKEGYEPRWMFVNGDDDYDDDDDDDHDTVM